VSLVPAINLSPVSLTPLNNDNHTSDKFIAGINNTGEQLSPLTSVSLTPVISYSQVSLIPVITYSPVLLTPVKSYSTVLLTLAITFDTGYK
jgi:hypothetical protein